ncbi:nuclear transport factor 2 family protein [Dactylosporangium sp. NPDC051541]|uniref:nuclear transport factor 2 family protein n=1 Tax=Dactylosporangium sp. NPDC051541 TaxID=3363977 RepID=UPI0037906847
MNADDRWAISEILALHAHIFDGGHLDRLDEIFTDQTVYDMTAVGLGQFEGIDTIRTAALQLGPRNPIAHHVTNIVITEKTETEATVLSKGLMIMADGTPASVTHQDTLHRQPEGWRITHRRITPQHTPLGGAHLT